MDSNILLNREILYYLELLEARMLSYLTVEIFYNKSMDFCLPPVVTSVYRTYRI